MVLVRKTTSTSAVSSRICSIGVIDALQSGTSHIMQEEVISKRNGGARVCYYNSGMWYISFHEDGCAGYRWQYSEVVGC
jgi:uncharacterized phosphosugar-binding protein